MSKDHWSSDDEPSPDKVSSEADSDSFNLSDGIKAKPKRQPKAAAASAKPKPETSREGRKRRKSPVRTENKRNSKKQLTASTAASYSSSDSDEDAEKTTRSNPTSSTGSRSPPSFMSKKIMELSRMKQESEITGKIRRLKDVAAAAPARTKAEKGALTKFFCFDCENYYATFPDRSVDLSACRHRRIEARPVSPPHYWDLDMVDSPEPAPPVDADPEPEILTS